MPDTITPIEEAAAGAAGAAREAAGEGEAQFDADALLRQLPNVDTAGAIRRRWRALSAWPPDLSPQTAMAGGLEFRQQTNDRVRGAVRQALAATPGAALNEEAVSAIAAGGMTRSEALRKLREGGIAFIAPGTYRYTTTSSALDDEQLAELMEIVEGGFDPDGEVFRFRELPGGETVPLFNPYRMREAVETYIAAGFAEPGQEEALRTSVAEWEKLVALADGVSGAINAMGIGAVEGAVIAGATVGGAKAGGAAGLALAPGTAGVSVPVGAAVGGLLGFGASMVGVSLAEKALAEQSATVRRHLEAAGVRPNFRLAGGFLSFSPAAVSRSAVGWRAWQIASRLQRRELLKRVSLAAGVNGVVDLALQDAALAAGWTDGVSIPQSAASAILGAMLGTYGIDLKRLDMSSGEASSLLLKARDRQTPLSTMEQVRLAALTRELGLAIETILPGQAIEREIPREGVLRGRFGLDPTRRGSLGAVGFKNEPWARVAGKSAEAAGVPATMYPAGKGLYRTAPVEGAAATATGVERVVEAPLERLAAENLPFTPALLRGGVEADIRVPPTPGAPKPAPEAEPVFAAASIQRAFAEQPARVSIEAPVGDAYEEAAIMYREGVEGPMKAWLRENDPVWAALERRRDSSILSRQPEYRAAIEEQMAAIEAETVGPAPERAGGATKEGVSNAVQEREAKEVLPNVRAQAGEGEGQVPAAKDAGGVRGGGALRAEETPEGLRGAAASIRASLEHWREELAKAETPTARKRIEKEIADRERAADRLERTAAGREKPALRLAEAVAASADGDEEKALLARLQALEAEERAAAAAADASNAWADVKKLRDLRREIVRLSNELDRLRLRSGAAGRKVSEEDVLEELEAQLRDDRGESPPAKRPPPVAGGGGEERQPGVRLWLNEDGSLPRNEEPVYVVAPNLTSAPASAVVVSMSEPGLTWLGSKAAIRISRVAWNRPRVVASDDELAMLAPQAGMSDTEVGRRAALRDIAQAARASGAVDGVILLPRSNQPRLMRLTGGEALGLRFLDVEVLPKQNRRMKAVPQNAETLRGLANGGVDALWDRQAGALWDIRGYRGRTEDLATEAVLRVNDALMDAAHASGLVDPVLKAAAAVGPDPRAILARLGPTSSGLRKGLRKSLGATPDEGLMEAMVSRVLQYFRLSAPSNAEPLRADQVVDPEWAKSLGVEPRPKARPLPTATQMAAMSKDELRAVAEEWGMQTWGNRFDLMRRIEHWRRLLAAGEAATMPTTRGGMVMAVAAERLIALAKLPALLARHLRYSFVKAATTARSLGPVGEDIARDMEIITLRKQQWFKPFEAEGARLLAAIPRKERKDVIRLSLGFTTREQVSEPVRAAHDYFQTKMDELQALHAQRSGRARARVGGVWAPQVLNDKGWKLVEAVHNRRPHPLTAEVLAKIMRDANVKTEAEAMGLLRRYAADKVSVYAPYLEGHRIRLPEALLDTDPRNIFPLAERMAETVAAESPEVWGGAVRRGDVDITFPGLELKIEALRQHGGTIAVDAQVLHNYLMRHFGFAPRTPGNLIVDQFVKFTMLTKLFTNIFGIAQNMMDRVPVLYSQVTPQVATKVLLHDYPPGLNLIMRKAQEWRQQALRTGYVFGQSVNLDEMRTTGPGSLYRKAGLPWAMTDTGTQTTAGIAMGKQIESDLRLLQEWAGGKLPGRLEAFARSLVGTNPAAVKRRLEKAGVMDLPPEEVARMIQEGIGAHPPETVANALMRLVVDSTFPMSLFSKPTSWQSHPFWRLLTLLKTWQVRRVGYIWNEVLGESIKMRSPYRLVGFLVGTQVVGEAFTILQDLILGTDKSLTVGSIKWPDEMTKQEVGHRMLANFLYGGAFGLLGTLTYGLTDSLGGPAWLTGKRFVQTAAKLLKEPDAAKAILTQAAVREVPAAKMVERVWARAGNENDFMTEYVHWDGYVRRYLSRQRATLGRTVGEIGERVFGGFPEFPHGARETRDDMAARNIIVGDIDDAAEWVASILRDARTLRERERLMQNVERSIRARTPLGLLPEREEEAGVSRAAFLQSLTPSARRRVLELEAEWVRRYRLALEKADRSTADHRATLQ
jgi:hypothetical protein